MEARARERSITEINRQIIARRLFFLAGKENFAINVRRSLETGKRTTVSGQRVVDDVFDTTRFKEGALSQRHALHNAAQSAGIARQFAHRYTDTEVSDGEAFNFDDSRG